MSPRTRFDTANGPIEVVRPLLGVTRDETRDSCAAQGLDVWDDPMNDDTRFTRVRARRTLELLTDSLGRDPRAGLVRTADLLREDADHLDAEAEAAWAGLLASAGMESGRPRFRRRWRSRDLAAFSPCGGQQDPAHLARRPRCVRGRAHRRPRAGRAGGGGGLGRGQAGGLRSGRRCGAPDSRPDPPRGARPRGSGTALSQRRLGCSAVEQHEYEDEHGTDHHEEGGGDDVSR